MIGFSNLATKPFFSLEVAGSQAYTTAVGTQNAFIMLTVFATVIWFSYFKVVK